VLKQVRFEAGIEEAPVGRQAVEGESEQELGLHGKSL